MTSSYGHPYYTERGWVASENLRAGDILRTVNGERVVVEFIQHEILENPQTLYNFEVADNHNYYVAESITVSVNEFVLAHNEGCPNPYGKKGGPKHQEKIKAQKDELETLGYKEITSEFKVDTPNGEKSRRFVDLVGTKVDGAGNVERVYYQIGKVTPKGVPVGREQKAIRDLIEASGETIIKFIPYN
jgi:hypothetical protein